MSWNSFAGHLQHFSAAEQKRIHAAYEMGEKAHKGQKRASGEPYFTHPVAVALLLMEFHADSDTVIAALLHDTVEDTSLTLDDIERAFGPVVRDLIDGITKLDAVDVEGKPTLDERIETLRKMFRLMQKDVRIMVIKLVDRLHNMETVSFLSERKQKALAEETRDVYVKIAERLGISLLANRLERLATHVLNPSLYADIETMREKNSKQGMHTLRDMEESVLAALPKGTTMEFEHKGWMTYVAESTEIQAGPERESRDIATDVTISFICDSIPACYETLGVIHQKWQRITLSFQDFINNPTINGYQGLHTSVILESGVKVRCKIRTQEMQTYAMCGIATLCFDGNMLGASAYLPWAERLEVLSSDTETRSDDFWESLKSDILEESIVVHGPDDRVIMLPQGSTVLDAAFHLFGSIASRAKEILLNGRHANFYEIVPYGSTIEIATDRHIQVSHAWLTFVRTGYASAIIREELSHLPAPKKQQMGEKILQDAAKSERKIDPKELHPQMLEKHFDALGVTSMEDLYMSVAEGRLPAERVLQELSPSRTDEDAKNDEEQRWILHASYDQKFDKDILQMRMPIYVLHSRYKERFGGIRLAMDFLATPMQISYIKQFLSARIPRDDWSIHPIMMYYASHVALIGLVILWGLDPVFAKLLLSTSLSPVNLTIIRFASFLLFATLHYGLQSFISPMRYRPINPLRPSLLLSSASLFLTAIFSYLALLSIGANLYILLMVTGYSLLSLFAQRKEKRPIHHSSVLLGIGILGTFFIAWSYGFAWGGIAYAVAAAAGFASYSIFSKKFQREEEGIQARYPAYLLWLSIFGFTLSIVTLFPFSSLTSIPPKAIALAAVFTLIFSVVPYVLYFECMLRIKGKTMERILPLACAVTLAGELILQPLSLVATVPIVLIVGWQFLQGKTMTFRGR